MGVGILTMWDPGKEHRNLGLAAGTLACLGSHASQAGLELCVAEIGLALLTHFISQMQVCTITTSLGCKL